jgi:tRNA(Ile)-lysidine synthase
MQSRSPLRRSSRLCGEAVLLRGAGGGAACPWHGGWVSRAVTPEQAVAAVRRAVRSALDGLPATTRAAPVLVAYSGGADSTALLAAARAVAPDRVHVAVVDHGLQDGSAGRSAALVADLSGQGVPAAVHTVDVEGGGGLEAAARRARYTALRAARPHPDSPVLLGHTLDDQAETVLLGLGRGSGARSLAGMTAWDPPWLRPLLGLRRADTAAACRAQGLAFWDDPHNADPRFTRVRLRHEVLPLLEDVLSGGVAEALARTAAQLRDDGEALDAAADLLIDAARRDTADVCPGLQESHFPATSLRESGFPATADGPGALDAAVLGGAPAAVRRRALRAWLGARGVTGLTDLHLRAADDLVARWRGQGAVALPQRLELVREHGRRHVRTAAWPGAR